MNRKWMLICHEMRTMRWFLLAGCICALVMSGLLYVAMAGNYQAVMNPGQEQYNLEFFGAYGSYFSEQLALFFRYGVIAGLLAFAFMSIIQFSELHNSRSREYLASLPFTQGECFAVKAGLGYGAITVSCLVLSAGVLFVRSRFITTLIKVNIVRPDFEITYGNETIWHTLRSLALFWLTLMAIYSIYITVQSLVGQGIIAGMIGAGAMLATLELGMVILHEYGIWLLYIKDMVRHQAVTNLYSHTTNILGVFFGMATGTSVSTSDETGCWNTYTYYENMWILFTSLAVILIGCTLLAYIVNRKRDLAYAGTLVPMRGARIAIGLGCGICFGTAITEFIFIDSAVDGDMVLKAIICLVLSAGIFLGCQKLLKRIVK